MGYKVAIVGVSGYVGGELLRILAAHPSVDIGSLTRDRQAGMAIGQVHPALALAGDHTIAKTTQESLANHDCVFLALPHGASESIMEFVSEGTLVIDCSADHRLTNASAWEQWYGGPYSGAWTYGLPELPGARTVLSSSRRVAAPGCYPTAVTLALAPALAISAVEPEVVVVAASGTSGAGKSSAPNLTSAEVMGSMSAYGVGGSHRHTPEMEQNLSRVAGEHVAVSFTPLLAPMTRGILATVSAPLRPNITQEDIRQAYMDSYGDELFVRLLSEGMWPSTAMTYGSNVACLAVTCDLRVNRLVAVCALDNLGKGAAGQAIQCMNIVLGLPEVAGLSQLGMAPC